MSQISPRSLFNTIRSLTTHHICWELHGPLIKPPRKETRGKKTTQNTRPAVASRDPTILRAQNRQSISGDTRKLEPGQAEQTPLSSTMATGRHGQAETSACPRGAGRGSWKSDREAGFATWTFSSAALAAAGAPTLGTPPPLPFFPVALELYTS